MRKQQCKKLAPVCDRYRVEKDLHGLRDESWDRSTAAGSGRRTVAGYETLWNTYLAPYLKEISLRDFRTVDAANLFAQIHRNHKVGRTTLRHCKSRLSGIFTLARNQGALDAPNPIQGSLIPKKAAAPQTHAAT